MPGVAVMFVRFAAAIAFDTAIASPAGIATA